MTDVCDIQELKTCPFCEADRAGLESQPQPSLHAVTIMFKCGAGVTVTLGQEGYVTERSCFEDEEDCAEWREYNGY